MMELINKVLLLHDKRTEQYSSMALAKGLFDYNSAAILGR